MRRGRDSRERQRGAALLLVLWTALLLSVLLAGALGEARIEAKIAAGRRAQFEADLALRAGLDLAAWRIASGDHENDGPIVSNFSLNGYSVTVERSMEGEKLDINRANESLIAAFLRHVGVEAEYANSLAAETADWRDDDDLPRPNGAEGSDYASAGGKSIANRPFNGVGEVREVLHMTPALYDCIAPALTIFGSGATPTTRAMALIGKSPMVGETAGDAILGTSVRGATAGGLHVIEAVATRSASSATPRSLTRVIRVTGSSGAPFAQIAEFRRKNASDARSSATGCERYSRVPTSGGLR